MSIPIVINGETFNIPVNLQSPGWGADTSDYLVALGAVAQSVQGPSDILNTTFVPANNVSSPANITGLSFDTSTVRGAIISYSIYRNTSLTEVAEMGTMYVAYKNIAMTWEIARSSVGDAGLTFSFSGGQLQYTSTNITGSSYTAKMVFSAKAFLA